MSYQFEYRSLSFLVGNLSERRSFNIESPTFNWGRRFDVEGLRNYPKTVKTFRPQNYYHRGFFLLYITRIDFFPKNYVKGNFRSNFKLNTRLMTMLLPIQGAFCNKRLLHQNSLLVQRLKTSGNNWVFLPIGFDGGKNQSSICEISKSDLSVSSSQT